MNSDIIYYKNTTDGRALNNIATRMMARIKYNTVDMNIVDDITE